MAGTTVNITYRNDRAETPAEKSRHLDPNVISESITFFIGHNKDKL
jgi:hypothetical protein